MNNTVSLADTMRLPPAFGRWLEARGWRPHDHQSAMLEAAARGRSALLIAPTGGGKTLAGFLPSLVELATRAGGGLHTLHVSPLEALTVDVARNVEAPVGEIGLPVRIETRTGDTPESRRRRQRRHPPDILLTTPESLALLLSYPDAATMLAGLRCVGDGFHGGAGLLHARTAARLRALVGSVEWIWVAGNHDPVAPEGLGRALPALDQDGPVLRHSPVDGARRDRRAPASQGPRPPARRQHHQTLLRRRRGAVDHAGLREPCRRSRRDRSIDPQPLPLGLHRPTARPRPGFRPVERPA
jgi:hypothetical protein